MSQIHNQLVASHEQMDLDEAQDRVQRILHGQAGPTLTPAPQTQPQAPAEAMRRGVSDEDMKKYVKQGISVPAPRKKRSDAGIPKGPKVPKGLLEVRFTIEPDSGFALHRWMVMEGYGDAAAELTKQLGKHYDEERLADERNS